MCEEIWGQSKPNLVTESNQTWFWPFLSSSPHIFSVLSPSFSTAIDEFHQKRHSLLSNYFQLIYQLIYLVSLCLLGFKKCSLILFFSLMFEHIIKQLWIVMKNASLLLCLMIPNIALFDYIYRLILVLSQASSFFSFPCLIFIIFPLKYLSNCADKIELYLIGCHMRYLKCSQIHRYMNLAL